MDDERLKNPPVGSSVLERIRDISDTQKFLIQYSFDWYLFVTQLYFVAR